MVNLPLNTFEEKVKTLTEENAKLKKTYRWLAILVILVLITLVMR